MWGISWQNLIMMLIDMPFTDYNTDKSNKEEEEIEINTPEDAIEHLKRLKKKP